jgi:hypothetical protein
MANMDLMDRLLATIRINVPGVTAQALNLELFNVIDEFFRRTSAWRYFADVVLSTDTIQYPIFPPSGSDLVRVISSYYRDRPVQSTGGGGSSVVTQSGRIVGVSQPDGDVVFTPNVTGTSGGVFAYSLFFPNYIELTIPPDNEAAQFPLTLVMALTLNFQCLEDEPNEWPLEEWMFSEFHQPWVEGVLAKLMGQISKPYSNPTMATYHAKRFRNFMAQAKQTAARGYTYNTPNWRFPGWAAQR